MTNQQLIDKLKEVITLLEAQEQGKQLQFCNIGEWKHYTLDLSNLCNCVNGSIKWRIKPEPRTWWSVFRSNSGSIGPVNSFDTEAQAIAWARQKTVENPPYHYEVRKVQEVIE